MKLSLLSPSVIFREAFTLHVDFTFTQLTTFSFVLQTFLDDFISAGKNYFMSFNSEFDEQMIFKKNSGIELCCSY